MSYKDTLLTPNTLFEMKANLVDKEPLIQAKWYKQNITAKRYAKNKSNKQFVLHDGPPYANGDLHVGHALNKILKDFIVRYQNQKGSYAPWICGWDTHGLPIETAVVNQGIDRKTTLPSVFRQICQQYALEQVASQSQQFSRLGLLTDFTIKYSTLDLDYELTQLRLFQTMVEKGLIYRHLKPIYWSPTSETALAEAEIEYEELSAPSIYITFSVTTGNAVLPTGVKVVIWTTTPWTIPMNQLLAVGSQIVYQILTVNNQQYLIAKDLVAKVVPIIGWEDVHYGAEIIGQDLIGVITHHPLYDRDAKIVAGFHVTTETGTGIVHIASGFGEEDYQIGRENNLPVYAPLNDEGKYSPEINDEQLVGMFYEDANKLITTRLTAKDALLKLKFIKHKHPIDWRTKKPVIYRATAQWFVSIGPIKAILLAEVKKVDWHPQWAKKRMEDMISNRNDWCISRQRLWGTPIIAFYDENDIPLFDTKVIEHVIKLFEQAQTTNIWFEWTADQLLPVEYQNKNYRKEQDIMDVWFDSGVSNLAVQNRFQLEHPFAVYFEGIDQFRGWFNSSLITSVIGTNHGPYQHVLAHGFVNDEKGRKMSKSIGNIIAPKDITIQYGADILRMWVASVDYSDDVKIGPEILKQVVESYRKIRNTIRFLLANLADFDPNCDCVTQLSEVDNYTLFLTRQFQQKIVQAYEKFSFNSVFTLINNFVITTLSKFYLDFTKDILYVENQTSPRRRAVQTTLYYIYRVLIDTLKPLIPHTTEEAHSFIQYPQKEESVHLEDNFILNIKIEQDLIQRWEKVLQVRDDINKALELAREQKIITKSLDCEITIFLKPEYMILAAIPDLYQIFIVSGLVFVTSPEGLEEYKTSFLSVKPKEGTKCARCWMIVRELAPNNEICLRCNGILNQKNMR